MQQAHTAPKQMAGNYVNVRIEAATDFEAVKAANAMGCWVPKDVKVYDKRDDAGVYIYARYYFPKARTQQAPVHAQPAQSAPRSGGRSAPRVYQPRQMAVYTPAPTGGGDYETPVGMDDEPAF